MATAITGRVLVVVEGKDDVGLIEHLAKLLGIQGVQAISAGSASGYVNEVSAIVKSPQFRDSVTALGLVRETDVHASREDALKSACDALERAGLSRPPLEPPYVAEGAPRTAVLLIPCGGGRGCMEDDCLSAAGESHPEELRCADDYFDCLDTKSVPRPKHMSKARLQVFLASRPETSSSLSVAAQKGYIPLDGSAFEDMRDFLRRLAEGG